MEALKEVTVWEVEYRQPNHTYLMDGDKAVAYIRWHEGAPEYFKTPQKLDKRYRKFEKVEPNPFGDYHNLQPALTYKEVRGSKGEIYKVDLEAGTCTCPGFTFRGTCKHTKEQ